LNNLLAAVLLAIFIWIGQGETCALLNMSATVGLSAMNRAIDYVVTKFGLLGRRGPNPSRILPNPGSAGAPNAKYGEGPHAARRFVTASGFGLQSNRPIGNRPQVENLPHILVDGGRRIGSRLTPRRKQSDQGSNASDGAVSARRAVQACGSLRESEWSGVRLTLVNFCPHVEGRPCAVPSWSANPDAPAPESAGTPFLRAVREQLGLKLVSSNGSIRTMVIDHVEKQSEN
jgi:hypothetical protein